MKNVIIGTAGHVDHGKTTLVKALTGIDTDRLEEEKRRGVTIEPGFAYLDFEDGRRAGIIDVPGHERFIRNMLAGSGGVDLAMLVVAADEGVMPQTREHLGILAQLGIGDGLVVVTKADKAEADWLELVVDDIEQLVVGTFLESKPILHISAFTGEGISELKDALSLLLDNAHERDVKIPFRLPVDRVFPVDGFGIVVTGTLIEGSVKVGDTAQILPSGEKAPIRNLQVHGENTETAFAGQRTAISLGGVKRGVVVRGDVITAEGTVNVTDAIDVKLNVLADTKRTIKNSAELHLYHGARTLLAKAMLIGQSELHHGESCYARLKLKEPLPCKRGDRFVVRFFSPMETIGGGVILDSKPKKRISRSEEALNALKIREQGSAEELTDLAAYELGGVFSETDLCKRADLDKKTCIDAVEVLVADGSVIQLMQNKYISKKVLSKLSKECTGYLESYHKSYPLRAGMNIAELRQKLLQNTDTAEATAVLKKLSDNGVIMLSEKSAALPDFSISYSPTQSNIHEKLIKELTGCGYDVKSPDELSALFSKNEKRDFEQVFESMISGGELVMISQQIFWLRKTYDKAIKLIRNHFEENDEITLAQCRDILGTSRKYALAFLEHLDGKQATKLIGDARKLNKGF
ncbi:MAG: selenocysteine-specific translation elongation factor [Oscillospiraceae bacterium]|nr:selenocysteine-specific translation elongation factor [Oscillospiraceae bacterium]